MKRFVLAGLALIFGAVLSSIVFADDVNARDGNSNTQLIYAALNGRTQEVKNLLNAGAEIDAKNKWGMTALMYAAENGRAETVKVLVEAGADVNAVNNEGSTALMIAAKHGSKSALEALLEGGADVNLANNDGKTALSYAQENNRSEIVKILTKSGEDDAVDNVNWEDMNSVRKAADSGNAEAQCRIARAFVNIRYDYDDEGDVPAWLKIDDTVVVGWLRKLAKTDNPEAKYLLVRAYNEELTEDSDDDDKIKMPLLQKAAEQNHADAQFLLGTYYKDGYGGFGNEKKDPKLALKWLTKAAENGNEDAPYYIGLMYYEGDGVKKDLVKAARWFRKSKDERAQEFLDEMKK